MTTTNDEPEIRVEGSKFSTNQEPDVPVAFASVLDSDRPPATAPTTSSGYAAAAASYPTTSTPSMFQGYEPEATPVATAIPTKKPSDNAAHNNNISSTTTSNDNNNTTSSSSAFIPPPAPVVGVGNGAIPPGAPPGGLWVICKYTGNNTWCIIGSTGCFLFWCCAIIFAPCALFGLLCPCDEKRAYMSPNGVMYDERGHAIGDRRRNKYRVISKA